MQASNVQCTSRFEREALAVTYISKKVSCLKCIHLLVYTSVTPSPDLNFTLFPGVLSS